MCSTIPNIFCICVPFTALLQVERKKAKGGSTAVGLFNPMRFLHSIETWKKEETEV